MAKDEGGWKGFGEIRDGTGRLLGWISEKNYMGVQQVFSSTGHTLGWSKDASELGGLPYTVDNHGKRVSHGAHPELLFNRDKGGR